MGACQRFEGGNRVPFFTPMAVSTEARGADTIRKRIYCRIILAVLLFGTALLRGVFFEEGTFHHVASEEQIEVARLLLVEQFVEVMGLGPGLLGSGSGGQLCLVAVRSAWVWVRRAPAGAVRRSSATVPRGIVVVRDVQMSRGSAPRRPLARGSARWPVRRESL